MYRDHVPCTVGPHQQKRIAPVYKYKYYILWIQSVPEYVLVPPEDLFSLPCTTLVPHHGLEVLYNITFRWKGEPLVRRVLEAGIEAMGTAGKPYRIGTVKQVYGVVSIFLGMCF